MNNHFYHHLKNIKLVSVKGTDAVSWLHRISSQNIKAMSVDDLLPAAFLTNKAHVISLFYVRKKSENEFWLYFEPQSFEKGWQFLQRSLFAEEVHLAVLPPEEQAYYFLFPCLADKVCRCVLKMGEGHFEFVLSPEELALDQFQGLREEEFHYYRAALGIPQDQREITEQNVVLESDFLSQYAHHNKGCYPGQEVVNKIRNLGSVSRKIIAICPDTETRYQINEETKEVFVDQEKAGEVVSTYSLPDKDTVVFCSIKKKYLSDS